MKINTIIYIGGFELPDKNAAAQRVLGNAKALKELGFNVVLVDIDRDTCKRIENSKQECFGFTRYSMQYTNKRLISISDFLRVIELYKQDNIKVIAYNYPGIALWKMLKYCRKNKIQIYADCTEWYGMLGDNIIKKIIKGADSFIRMNIVHPKMDGIISISRYLEKYYQRKLPTICVPPLTDISESKWEPETSDAHTDIRILYAGNPGKHKDKINRIIEALSEIENVNFVFWVVGLSEEQFLDYYPEVRTCLEKLGNRVDFMGRISHTEVIHLLKQSDFSMFYRDITRVTMAGFPTKFSEAITCGTPVITNKTSDLEEYLIPGNNGYWIEDDIEKSILNILKNHNCCNLKNKINRKLFDYHGAKGKLEQLLMKEEIT